MNRVTHLQTVFRFGTLTLLVLVFAGQLVSSAAAAEPVVDPVLVVACEIENASEAMRDELKTHFRRVRRYGLMVGTSALIKSRAKAIERRFKRDPNYRGLDRDVTRVCELANRLAKLVQEAVNCPEQCARIEGDYCHVVDRSNQILSLAESLRIAATPYCIVVDRIVAEYPSSNPFSRGSSMGYQPYGGAYRYDLSEGMIGGRRAPLGPLSGQLEAAQRGRRTNVEPTWMQPRSGDPFRQVMPLPNQTDLAPGIPTTQPRIPMTQPRLISPEPSLRPTIEPAQPILVGPQPSMRSVLESGGRR